MIDEKKINNVLETKYEGIKFALLATFIILIPFWFLGLPTIIMAILLLIFSLVYFVESLET